MTNELNQRFLTHGGETLTNRELLTIISGNHKAAQKLMEKTDGFIAPISSMFASELKKEAGATDLQALRIMAAMEIGRRKAIEVPRQPQIVRTSKDMAGILQAFIGDSPVEKFVVVFLNRANKIKKMMVISEGGITGTVADPRIILRHAVLEGAVSIVLSHNHPSGSLRPSRADEQLTQKIKEAASFLDITVLDHVIVSQTNEYYSFADEGLI